MKTLGKSETVLETCMAHWKRFSGRCHQVKLILHVPICIFKLFYSVFKLLSQWVGYKYLKKNRGLLLEPFAADAFGITILIVVQPSVGNPSSTSTDPAWAVGAGAARAVWFGRDGFGTGRSCSAAARGREHRMKMLSLSVSPSLSDLV